MRRRTDRQRIPPPRRAGRDRPRPRGDRARVRPRDRARLPQRPPRPTSRCRPTAPTPRSSSRARSTPRSSTSPVAAGSTCGKGSAVEALKHDAKGVRADARRRHRRSTRRSSSPPTAIGRRFGAWSHPTRHRDLGEWHAVRQYFDGVDDERLWVVVRTRSAARLRVGVSAAGRARQRRLRRVAIRRPQRAASSKDLWPDLLARPITARNPRPERATIRVGARVADPDAVRTRTALVRARAASSATRPASSTR